MSPISFSQAEGHLRALLREFGPPRKTGPGYPFHHLVSDGLWQVRTADGAGSPGAAVGALRASGAERRLAPDLVAALDHDAHLLARLVRTLLDANFEPSLHPDICAAAGLDHAKLLGLGLSIDYSLLVVTRWREERAAGQDNTRAVHEAVKRAGHSVWFSGTVASLGLFALIVVPNSLVRGIGVSGLFISSSATLVALTLLPAVLSVIGPRPDWPRRRTSGGASRFWTGWAKLIIRYRVRPLITTTQCEPEPGTRRRSQTSHMRPMVDPKHLHPPPCQMHGRRPATTRAKRPTKRQTRIGYIGPADPPSASTT